MELRMLTTLIMLTVATSIKADNNEKFAITLPCEYRMSNIPWPVLGEIYECYIEHNLHITHPQMPISDANGEHKNWKNNAKVFGFYARAAEVFYFPNGLEKIFPNLKLIAIAMSELKEVKQKNLMPFDQLQYLCLFANQIETIDKHLFAYNILLEAIDLRENKILKINVNVFDYLINLRILYTSDAFNTSCVSSDAGDREAVVKLISDIKRECNDRAIGALLRKKISVKKFEEERANLTKLITTSTPKREEKVSIVTEKTFIEELVTEEEIDDEDNVIDSNWNAQTSGGRKTFGGLILMAVMSFLVKSF